MTTRTLVGADDREDPRQGRIREAIHIVATGQIPEQPDRLTRRKRHLVVAADRWNDHATVWFSKRGHSGRPDDESIRLEYDGTQWKYQGGDGSSPGVDLSTRLTLQELASHFSRQYHHTKAEQIPYGFSTGGSFGPALASVRFQTVAEVTTLTFNDREQRPVANHGYCIVAYNPRRPPTITALDKDGTDLGSFTPKRKRHRQHLSGRHLLGRFGRRRHTATNNRRRSWFNR